MFKGLAVVFVILLQKLKQRAYIKLHAEHYFCEIVLESNLTCMFAYFIQVLYLAFYTGTASVFSYTYRL